MTGRRLAAVCAAALAAACAEPGDRGPVALETEIPDAAERGPVPGTWREGQLPEPVPVTLAWDPRRDPPWRTGRVLDAKGEVRAQIALGPAAALLLYHAASQEPALAGALHANRLASISPAAAARAGVALLFEPGALAPQDAGLRALAPDAAAETLAAAEALGAWAPLRAGRLDRGGRLPLFVPEAPGPWIQLRGASLESFLPDGLAAHVASTPDLRAASYARLAEHAARLPALADAVDALAAASPARVPAEDRAALRALLESSAHAYASYLDSVWLELLVAEISSDAARLALHAHTVIPLELRGFELPLSRAEALGQSDAIGRLRLHDEDRGEAAAAQVTKQGLFFDLRRRVEPVALGPERFGSTQLRFRLEGLEGAPEDLRGALLRELAPRLVEAPTGEPVPEGHWRRAFSIVDHRFGAAREEDLGDFLAAVPVRLRRDDGEGAALRVDPGRQLLTLAAGRYRLRDDLVPPPGWGLRLAAGVELAVAPGRSILVRGPLRVEGRAERPVRIGPLEEGAAWGVLAVQGRGLGAVGDAPRPRSEVHHLELAGGSGDDLRGVHYRGQLSVYHQDLRLRDTTLRDARGEASLDATGSRLEASDLRVLDSAADGVRLENARGVLRRARIERSGAGDDGLDVARGSDVALEASVVAAAGDECVEVGERSRLRLSGVLLRGCPVGLASKDLAEVQVNESAFLANETHMTAYQNREVFGVGRIDAAAVLQLDADRGGLAAADAFSAEDFRRLSASLP